MKEEAEMKQAQPMGQRMDQARARFRRAVEAGEKAKEAMLKAQANFEQAQQEVCTGPTGLARAHAGSATAGNASSTSQREPGQILGSFDRTCRKHVESGGRTTTRPTDPRNPRVKGDSSHLISNPVPGRRRSCGGRDGRRPRPGRGRSRRDGRLRGGARSRRVASGAEADTQGCGGTRAPNAATAKEDANNRAGGFERERSTFAGSTQIAEVQNEGQAQGERVVQLVALQLRPAEPWEPTQMRVDASERELLERELRRDVLGDSDVWNSLRGGVQRWGGDG